jgi:hypothetical protein
MGIPALIAYPGTKSAPARTRRARHRRRRRSCNPDAGPPACICAVRPGNNTHETEFRPNRARNRRLKPSWNSTRERIRGHVFRAWTACAILAAYVYGWLYAPEVLTWWKRTTTTLIEAGCDLLPYPWGDRIEATLGNFGLWVQITLAIIVFRILMWLVISVARRMWSAPGRGRSLPSPAPGGRSPDC